MGSVHGPRYCKRGQQCRAYAQIGEPQKLRGTSKIDICDPCEQARLQGDPTAAEPSKKEQLRAEDAELELYKEALGLENLTLLESSVADELIKLQGDFLVEHLLRRGDFWEAIRGLRERWNISPTEAIPPGGSRRSAPLPKPEEMPRDEWNKLHTRWLEDLSSVGRFFPKRLKAAGGLLGFVTCCAFYDPPRDKLFAFFQESATASGLSLPEGWEDRKDETLVAMSALPVKEMPNPLALVAAWRTYYRGLIRELGERHLKPLGLDVEVLVEDVLSNNPVLTENLEARIRLENDQASQYIEVDDDTTKEDVTKAFKFITQSREPRKGGRPGRSRLIAVQYAILKDEYGWTYRQIADTFERQTDDTFLRRLKDHVKFGREILKKG